MLSIRFFSRARIRTRERGFVLVSALVLAVLYFALMELMMIDASRALAEARRFRARVVAATLAENGVELASARMVTQDMAVVQGQNEQGTMTGQLTKTQSGSPVSFTLNGAGSAIGVTPAKASVEIRGRIVEGSKIYIDYSYHSQ